MELLTPPADDFEVIPVRRLRVRFRRNGEEIEGWASLTGRVVEDNAPILEVTQALSEPGTAKLSNVSTKDSAAKTMVACPLCDYLFPDFYTVELKNIHITNCSVEELKFI